MPRWERHSERGLRASTLCHHTKPLQPLIAPRSCSPALEMHKVVTGRSTSKRRSADTPRVSPSSPFHRHRGEKQPGEGPPASLRLNTTNPTSHPGRKHPQGTSSQQLVPRDWRIPLIPELVYNRRKVQLASKSQGFQQSQ